MSEEIVIRFYHWVNSLQYDWEYSTAGCKFTISQKERPAEMALNPGQNWWYAEMHNADGFELETTWLGVVTN